VLVLLGMVAGHVSPSGVSWPTLAYTRVYSARVSSETADKSVGNQRLEPARCVVRDRLWNTTQDRYRVRRNLRSMPTLFARVAITPPTFCFSYTSPSDHGTRSSGEADHAGQV
jgi:hypothetical protein